MRKKSLKPVAFFFACIVLLSGCRKKASDEIDFGTVENSVYKNNYFGLAITLPSDWNIQDRKTIRQMTDMGSKMISGEDKNLKAAIKASELQTLNLFAVMKHPLGSPVSSNPNISCVAERVRHMPGIKRGSDYLFHSRKLLESGQLNVSFPEEVTTEKLGDKEFDVMHVEISIPGTTIRQKYYTAIMKGYALSFIASFTTEEEEAFLDNILSSVKFEQ